MTVREREGRTLWRDEGDPAGGAVDGGVSALQGGSELPPEHLLCSGRWGGGLSRGEGRGGQLRWLQDDGDHLKWGAGEQGSRAVRGAEGWAPVGVGRLRGPLWAQVPPRGSRALDPPPRLLPPGPFTCRAREKVGCSPG